MAFDRRVHDKKYYERCRNDPEYVAAHKDQVTQRRIQRRQLVDGIKIASGCVDCQSGTVWPPECLDFDHVRGKKVNGVAKLFTATLETLMAEIAKCEVVCANHHRIRTKQRGSSS